MGTIENLDIQGCVARAVTETFRTNLSMEMAFLQEEPPPESVIHRMAGTLHFAGKVTDSFNIQLTAPTSICGCHTALGPDPFPHLLGSLLLRL